MNTISLKIGCILLFALLLTGCDDTDVSGLSTSFDDIATVTRVIDGDTIDVRLQNGTTARVRYIGVNTPEDDEPCYREATAANAALIQNQQVRMVRDVSNTDPFNRLLRYVYVGNTFVNAVLVQQGWAEAVVYEPDTRYFDIFRQYEQDATTANIGCHPTGIFNDGDSRR